MQDEPMKEPRDDEELTGIADYGWVNDMSEPMGLSGEKLDDLIARFGCSDEDMKAELRKRLPDAYKSFVKCEPAWKTDPLAG
jgi:hypothetical protein